jgi:2-furoate---CoA ligase
MLDLGTSFIASLERDPNALAIVDGTVQLTYRAWYAKISAMIAALDDLGLHPGDLVTVLQNRWEAATIHWACQFAGIIITPLNWRAMPAYDAFDRLGISQVRDRGRFHTIALISHD